MRDFCKVCQAMRFRSECKHPPAANENICRETLDGITRVPCQHGYTWQCPTARRSK